MFNNKIDDELGVARTNSALPIYTRGIFRVSGVYSSTLDGTDVALGVVVMPNSTSSGIVGQTGASGVGPCWATAAMMSISGNPTGAPPKGVAKIVGLYKGGDASANQLDIMIYPQRPDVY